MRSTLDALLRTPMVFGLTAGLALALALIDFARGVSTLVLSALAEHGESFGVGGLLTVDIGSRTLEFGQVVQGAVVLAVVVAIAMTMLRLSRD